ncbi:MAG: restriction endonuclease subunit S [Microcystis sp. LE19-84.1B]|jgi:type I restriction enzyme S subunit|uniref:restriction endonuclease subunit S n=1 Tax=Microcystis sp. LE19-84.1B TaxID=3016438 RepID=UPI0022BDF06D|nr:restriction endonuclease subunit S [Microcystis sp. LE19-84.1B]MCZ8225014.1 restriction endonuclease subunit S [Microcystis sp. LE19-84.1B]
MSVEGWKLRRLDEIGEICSGSTPSTNNLSYWDGDITWVTPNDLSKLNTPYLITSSKKITQQGLKSCSAQIVPIGSIILSSRAPIGYLAISLVDCCTNQGCKSFNLNPEYDSEFVYYNLKYNINKIKNLGEGTTFAEISKTALSKIQISFLENKQEQTQIATILSTIDRAIEQTEALISKQQRIKTGLMQDLLTKGIDENGNIRSEETHDFKDSPLGRIPVEWEVKNIGETLEDITYGLTVRPKYVEEGIPLISAKECGNGSIDYESCNKIMQQDFKRLRERSLPKYGDVLITKTGTLGRVARINQSDPYSAITQNVALLRPNIKIIRPEFLEIILNSEKIQKDIKDGVTVLSIPDLQLGVLAKFEFPIPSLNEQDKLIRQIEKFDADTLLNKKYLSKIKLLKTGLMQDLLTGKVRVTDLLNQNTAAN